MADFLLDLGASLQRKGLPFSSLHVSVAADIPGIASRLVLERHIDLDIKDSNGDTPLVYSNSSPCSTEETIEQHSSLDADVNKITAYYG